MSMCRAWAVASAAGLLASVAGSAVAAPTEHEKLEQEVFETKPDSVSARRLEIEAVARQFRGATPAHAPRVIYGDDNRIEVYEETDPQIRAMAEAACVVAFASEVTNNGDGTYTLSTSPWTSAGFGTLCTDEPFRGQPTIGFCSGFLVGPDLITTAGHCVDPSEADDVVFIFGFQLNDADETGPMVVPEELVYFGTTSVDQALSGGLDHSVVQLDRPVTGINPVPIRRDGLVSNGDPMVVIGHPATLPKKISGGAIVQDNQGASTPWFQSNLDTYGGNSGSMVINASTYTVEGILVRGAPDYRTRAGDSCTESNRVPDTGNTGSGLEFEECSKTSFFAASVPPLGLQVGPLSGTLHIGAVGGPFNDPDTTYTLGNSTTEALDVSVDVTGPDANLFTLSTITRAETATIAAGGSSMITVSLNEAMASALPAGVYTADVVFTDVTNGRDTVVTHTVEVGQSLVDVAGNNLFGGGPVGGPFNISGMYEVTSERPTPADMLVSADVPWLDIDVTSFTLNGDGASQTVTVSVNSLADALPAGLATGTVTFTNQTSGDTTEYAATVDVGRFAYAGDNTPLTITDNATFTSTVTVPDGYCVGDVDVDLDLTHTFSGDLIITLTSPEGTSVVLQNEGGGSDPFTPRYYDDDDAMNTAPEGPGMLSDFDGENVGGTWTLTVEDDANGDTGTLNSWQLRVASSGDICPPTAIDGSLSLPQNGLGNVTLAASSASGSYDVEITSLPARGVLWEGSTAITSAPYMLSGDMVTYRATPGESGSDSFTFKATDGALESEDATVSVTIGGPGQVAFFGFDSNPGWSTEGEWGFGQPTGGGGSGFASGPDPTSGFTGTNVYGYNLNGDYANEIATTHYLTTTPIATNGADGLSVNFRRWLGMESSTFDGADFQVSADGGPWTDVWVHDGGSFGDDAWVLVEYDLAAIVGSPNEIQLRWGLGPTDTSVVYPGWNIDDVEITGLGIGDANPADLNGDGLLNNTDINLFVSAFLGGQPIGDMNGDGILNNTDINLFVSYFLAG